MENIENIIDPRYIDIDDEMDLKNVYNIFNKELNEKEKYVMRLRFGLNMKCHTLAEISKIIGVSYDMTIRVLSKCFYKIKHKGHYDKPPLVLRESPFNKYLYK